MNSENAIEVRDVTKSFKIYFDKGHNLREKVVSRKRNRYELRKVLNGISFDVKRGEAVGLLGKNGCGKSTTLKLLTRILSPDSGTIDIKGRVCSLIELGAGFHPDMTGRENIYINASIFGIKSKEVDQRIDTIIRFSELEDYIDNPVRTYSSGMYMRLAFAVAINIDADVLLIDEILAVGDANFQEKCFQKLMEIKKSGTTIVIVSHSMAQIQTVCDRAIWIDKGSIRDEGPSKLICSNYLKEMQRKKMERAKAEMLELKKQGDLNATCFEVTKQCGPAAKREGKQDVKFTNVSLLNQKGEETEFFEYNDKLTVKMKYESHEEGKKVDFSIGVIRADWIYCYGVSTCNLTEELVAVEKNGEIEISIDRLMLTTGKYHLDVKITGEDGETCDELSNIIEFEIATVPLAGYGVAGADFSYKINE